MFIMKKKIKMTLEEIVQGWGSLEAYLEEQRRSGICELETKAFKVSPANNLQPAFFASTQLNPSEPVQPAVSPDFALSSSSGLELPQTNHLAFIRWLYISGRLES